MIIVASNEILIRKIFQLYKNITQIFTTNYLIISVIYVH